MPAILDNRTLRSWVETDLSDTLECALPVRSVIDRARLLSSELAGVAPLGDREGRFHPETRAALSRSGLPLAVFPTAAGGEGLLDADRACDLAAVLRLVGAGDLSAGRIFEGHVNAIGLAVRYGTVAQVERLAGAVRGGALSAVWNAEGRVPLVAERAGDGWRLRGQKILASGAGFIAYPVVTPTTTEGVLMVMPELAPDERADTAGWTPQGMRATATGTVDFSDMIVPANVQIGAAGDYLRQPVFSGGAWRFCAVHLGAAESLLDLLRTRLRERGRAEDPYQKQRVALAVVAVTTAAMWVERAAALVAEESVSAESVVAFVNLTRMTTERACLDVLELVHRGLGLGAFMRPDPVERISRDLATYLRQPVPDAAMADAARFALGSEIPVFDLWSPSRT